MTASVVFPNVTAYAVTRFDVRLGEKFQIVLGPEAPTNVRWFADADPVLHIVTMNGGAIADVEATDVGDSTIQLQADGVVVLTLECSVYGTEAAGFRVPEPVNEPL
mgnify:CR=1 FL=1